jgi:hypothetical protein
MWRLYTISNTQIRLKSTHDVVLDGRRAPCRKSPLVRYIAIGKAVSCSLHRLGIEEPAAGIQFRAYGLSQWQLC